MTKLTSAHDLLAAIPFLIGYHPENSLVVVSLKDETVGMAMRVDYPQHLPEVAYDLLASHLTRDQAQGALLVAYIPHDRCDGEVVLRELANTLSRVDISVQESICVKDGRYRSVICRDLQCCPEDGTEVPRIDSSRIALEQVIQGRPMPFPNIETLMQSLDSLPLSREPAWIATVEKFAPPSDENKPQDSSSGRSEALNLCARDGARAVLELAEKFHENTISHNLELIARVIGRLGDIQVRDFALGSSGATTHETYFLMWRHLIRIAPRGHVAPIACLFAALAYEKGDGALATCALNLALIDQPGYSLALLLRRVFSAGWPTSSFAALRKELHPKVCAGIFGEKGGLDLPPGHEFSSFTTSLA
jgi:hypothetical protein